MQLVPKSKEAEETLPAALFGRDLPCNPFRSKSVKFYPPGTTVKDFQAQCCREGQTRDPEAEEKPQNPITFHRRNSDPP